MSDKYTKVLEKIKLLEQRVSKIERLTSTSAGQAIRENKEIKKKWYRPNSTTEKIIFLINEGFFDKPQNLNKIIQQLKKKDIHLKTTELTDPLRRIVRKGLLEKTKDLQDGVNEKGWHYFNCNGNDI